MCVLVIHSAGSRIKKHVVVGFLHCTCNPENTLITTRCHSACGNVVYVVPRVCVRASVCVCVRLCVHVLKNKVVQGFKLITTTTTISHRSSSLYCKFM